MDCYFNYWRNYLWLKIIWFLITSVLAEDLFQGWSEVNCDCLDEVIAAVVRLLDISWLNNTNIKSVDVREESLIDSLLELSDIFCISEFSDNGKTCVLDVKNGFVNFCNVMFRNFHPCQSTIASIFSWQVSLLETAVKL